MGPTLYRKKGPLVVFLLPAFLFLILFLYSWFALAFGESHLY